MLYDIHTALYIDILYFTASLQISMSVKQELMTVILCILLLAVTVHCSSNSSLLYGFIPVLICIN